MLCEFLLYDRKQYVNPTGAAHAPIAAPVQHAPIAAPVQLPAVPPQPAADAAKESAAVQPAAHDEPPTNLFHADRMRKKKLLIVLIQNFFCFFFVKLILHT